MQNTTKKLFNSVLIFTALALCSNENGFSEERVSQKFRENPLECISKESETCNLLDSETIEFLEAFSKMFASIADLPIAEQRTIMKEMFKIEESQLESIEKIEDRVISGRHGPINMRLFSPKIEGSLPVIIFFHRGGWVYGSIEESEMICRRLANETGAIIAAVEYRLSPEHKFPIPLEDCYDATQWIIENTLTFSGDPDKVILCGESAGGNLAAAVALMNRETALFKVAGQLLIYPVLTSDLDRECYDNSPDKSLLSFENMQFFLNAYLSSPEEGENPLVSPLKSDDFSQLPRCFIITAEHDALKHEGERYGEALKKAQVDVEIACYPGVIHGFLDFPLAEAIKKRAIEDIGSWVKNL